MFLAGLYKIDTIYIVYQNTRGNKIEKKVKIDIPPFKQKVLIFSEAKQENYLQHIQLQNPKYIKSLHIEYTNKKNKSLKKIINFNEQMVSDNLYLYKDGDYTYNFNNLFNINKSLDMKEKTFFDTDRDLIFHSKTDFNFKLINANNLLKIFYDEDHTNLYLKIQGCQINGKCIEPTYQKENKVIVFKFKFKNNHTQKIVNNTFSELVKRIEIGFHSDKIKNNHLVIESKRKKIKNITRMYFNEDNILTKFNGNKINNKQLLYRIEF